MTEVGRMSMKLLYINGRALYTRRARRLRGAIPTKLAGGDLVRSPRTEVKNSKVYDCNFLLRILPHKAFVDTKLTLTVVTISSDLSIVSEIDSCAH